MIRELLAKATGEWKKSADDRPGMEWNCTVESEQGTICFMARSSKDDEYSHDRAALIVALHNLAPEMIAVVEAAERVNELTDRGDKLPLTGEWFDAMSVLSNVLHALKEKEGKL